MFEFEISGLIITSESTNTKFYSKNEIIYNGYDSLIPSSIIVRNTLLPNSNNYIILSRTEKFTYKGYVHNLDDSISIHNYLGSNNPNEPSKYFLDDAEYRILIQSKTNNQNIQMITMETIALLYSKYLRTYKAIESEELSNTNIGLIDSQLSTSSLFGDINKPGTENDSIQNILSDHAINKLSVIEQTGLDLLLSKNISIRSISKWTNNNSSE